MKNVMLLALANGKERRNFPENFWQWSPVTVDATNTLRCNFFNVCRPGEHENITNTYAAVRTCSGGDVGAVS